MICNAIIHKDYTGTFIQMNAIQKGHNVTSNDPKDDPKELSERQKLMLKEMNTNDTITIAMRHQLRCVS